MNQKLAFNKWTHIGCIFVLLCILLPTSTDAQAASVSLTWDANNPAPDGYRVFARRADQVYDYSRPDWEGTAILATVNNLQDQTDYYFVVRAYQGHLESADSKEVHYTPPPPNNNPASDTMPPYWDGHTLGIGSATALASGGSVTVEFDRARDSVDGANIRFNVYYGPTEYWDDHDWTGNSVVAEASVSSGNTYAHAVTVDGLTNGISYTFGVRVEDRSGNEDTNTNTLRVTPNRAENPAVSNPGEPQTAGLIPNANWRLIYVNSEERVGEDGRGINAFDGNPNTFWHTEWFYRDVRPPHEIQIDLGATYRLESFRYLPRQDGNTNGRIRDYAFYVSDDASNWNSAVATGRFANSAAEKTVFLNTPAVGRYIRLVALNEVAGRAWTSVADISFIGTHLSEPLPAPGSSGPPTATGLISQNHWRLIYVNSEERVGEDGRGLNAFDGNPNTFWHTEWFYRDVRPPHEIQIDLGASYRLESFRYLPRQDGNTNGRIRDFAFYVSDDASNWNSAVATGRFANSAAEKTVFLNTPAVGRYIRLVALNEVAGRAWTSVADIKVAGSLQQ